MTRRQLDTENRFFLLVTLLALAGAVLAIWLATPEDFVTWPVKRRVAGWFS